MPGHSGPAEGRPEHKPCAGHPRLISWRKAWMAGTPSFRTPMPGHDG